MKKHILYFILIFIIGGSSSYAQGQRQQDGDDEEEPVKARAAAPDGDAPPEEQQDKKEQRKGKSRGTQDEDADGDEDVKHKDEQGDVVLIGRLTPSKLAKIKDFGLPENGTSYGPDEDAEGFLKDRLKDFTLMVFIGTWDPDSQEMIPELLRVLQDIDYPITALKIYGLDKFKQGQNNEAENYHLSVVPTILVMDGKKEAGRVEGLPKETVEKDLREIVRNYSDGNEGESTEN